MSKTSRLLDNAGEQANGRHTAATSRSTPLISARAGEVRRGKHWTSARQQLIPQVSRVIRGHDFTKACARDFDKETSTLAARDPGGGQRAASKVISRSWRDAALDRAGFSDDPHTSPVHSARAIVTYAHGPSGGAVLSIMAVISCQRSVPLGASHRYFREAEDAFECAPIAWKA